MKGYKVFNDDWTCRGFKYEVGKTYSMPAEDLKLCESGFHFCTQLIDCFDYYNFDISNKVAEVEALGKVLVDDGQDDSKRCTNIIHITREIPWSEVDIMLNTGDDNYGYMNTGKNNVQHYNSGNFNFGMFNAGDVNLGDHNSSDFCDGYGNTGDYNTGSNNSGVGNCGCNNTGSNNYGNFNSGDWNCTDGSTGCFNTKAQPFYMFNQPVQGYTLDEWRESFARMILARMPKNSGTYWEAIDQMTAAEQKEYPWCELTGGVVKCKRNYDAGVIYDDERQEWWNGLSDLDKREILSLPNFDAEIFRECTGIDVYDGGDKYEAN